MSRSTHSFVIVFNVFLLLFIVAAGYHNIRKPGLPESDRSLYPLQIDSTRVKDADDAELLLSRYAIGDSLRLAIDGAEGTPVVRMTAAVPYDSRPFVLFKLVLAFAVFLLGALVFFFRSAGMEALLFNVASGALAASIAGTKTMYSLPPAWFGDLACGMFFGFYVLQAVLFLHFTMHFPSVKSRAFLGWMPLVYLLACGVSLWGSLTYLSEARDYGVARLESSPLPEAALNAFVVTLLVLGVINFIHTYATTSDISEKRKLRWVLFGLCVGPAPFIFLSALPRAFGAMEIVPESLMLGFLAILPATFAVAIVKHRILNIDLIINRSVVYGLTLGLLLALSILLFAVLAELLNGYAQVSSPLAMTVVSVLFAFTLQPLKRGVQEFVDKRFFVVRYNYRQTQRKLFDEIRRVLRPEELAGLIIDEFQRILPVDRIGFFVVDSGSDRLALTAHDNMIIPASGADSLHIGEFDALLGRPVALDDSVEPGLDVASADVALFARRGIALALPCESEEGGVMGVLVLGRKKSGFRFLSEDVDLLSGIAAQAGLALQRLALQEKLILEHAETERLVKLNMMKSFFVASVTHDLKTPLTSIKMFAELLRTNGVLPAKDRSEYLEIIEGESDRLSRMINNVLDFSQVERGVKTYRPVSADFNDAVENVLRSVNYQLTMERFTLERNLTRTLGAVRIDTDAFAEAVYNLISNAMKFSLDVRQITVSTFKREQWACVRVEDKGVGFSTDERQRIFDQFYRVDDSRTRGVGGAGLGLSIVHHIMDAHGGAIEVESAPGVGSAFTLLFPME